MHSIRRPPPRAPTTPAASPGGWGGSTAGGPRTAGSPAVDRLRATRFGNAAADLVDAGRSGVLPVLRGGRIEVATMTDAVREVRRLSDDIIELVRRYAGVVD